MSDIEIFDYLVIGLAKLLQQDCKYPYPELFQRACNVLALTMKDIPYPRTLTGFFKLLEEPVKDWYPLTVPQTFDPDFGLTTNRYLMNIYGANRTRTGDLLNAIETRYQLCYSPF